MMRLLPLLLALALLGGCTAAAVTPGETAAPGPAATWDCTPIDPLMRQLPANPCFRAVLSAQNEITLQWRVENAEPQVYIYDDFGKIADVGFKPAACPGEPRNTCAASLVVTTGGFRRWVLGAQHSGGARIHASADITIPSPPPPSQVYGSGFVDVLSPDDRTVTWIVDQAEIPCEEVKQNAWIEREGSIFYEARERYPRCGRGARFTVPAAKLKEPGFHDFRFRDCHRVDETRAELCSPYVWASFHTGSDHFLGPNPQYVQSGRDLTISFTGQSGDVRRLSSSTLIRGQGARPFVETSDTRYTIDARLLTPGTHSVELKSCASALGKCSASTRLQILVDSPMQWELGRAYTEDFTSGVGYPVIGHGAPLDITYDASGGIWLINEFSSSIEHVSPERTSSTITVPLARTAQGSSRVHEPVTPFAADAGVGKPLSGYRTTLGERATLVDTTVWFTQGGGMLGDVEIPNHSRIVSYDPSLSDSPATPYDDRLCVYNVPTDDPDRFGNNQVIGLSATDGRIWIGESRSLFNDAPSAISSFVPNPGSCGNLLDFADPEALASQPLQYCGAGRTPEQDGCMQKYLLDELPAGLKVAHVETDPVDDSIWFTDARGKYLGHLDPQRKNALAIHPLPQSHGELGFFLGFPWNLRVDEGAVYIAEYAAGHILRFDKATAAFHEIQVPLPSLLITLHSIDIDAETDRLWFTLNNDTPITGEVAESTIGYIDLASWRDYLADPARNATIAGVIYKGLDAVQPPKHGPFIPSSFRGIAVDPDTGRIALANNARKQVTELTPNGSFRP